MQLGPSRRGLIRVAIIAAMLAAACTPVTEPTTTSPPPTATTTTTSTTVATSQSDWTDPSLPIESRIDALLAVMTLEQKVAQMTLVEIGSIDAATVQTLGIGGVLSGGDGIPEENTSDAWIEMVGVMKDAAASSDLGIPLLYGIDAVHGNALVASATVFPHNIGLGAIGDPILVERIGEATAVETAAVGINWNFAPVAAVVQDVRWGRTYESYGSDPALVGKLASAYASGLTESGRVAATAKHFVGDGGTSFGSAFAEGYLLDQGDTKVSDAELQNVHLAPYPTILDAGARTVMISFSRLNGVFMHGNKPLIDGVLKREMGFDGLVVSDWGGMDHMHSDYGTAIAMGIGAGIDMNMVPYDYERFIQAVLDNVESGAIDVERIDDAVRRILRVKFEMGLFDDESFAADIDAVGSHRNLAREAVARSLTVLSGTAQLSIDDGADPTIGVAGPGADDTAMQAGGWTMGWQGAPSSLPGATSVLDALEDEAPGMVTHLSTRADWTAAQDRRFEVGIVVVGEEPYAEGVGDVVDATLAPGQVSIVERMRAVADHVVVIVIAGRPLAMDPVFDIADSVIMAWLPGSEGAGITDVLFGHAEPEGTLPVPWPASGTGAAGSPEGPIRFPVGYASGE